MTGRRYTKTVEHERFTDIYWDDGKVERCFPDGTTGLLQTRLTQPVCGDDCASPRLRTDAYGYIVHCVCGWTMDTRLVLTAALEGRA